MSTSTTKPQTAPARPSGKLGKLASTAGAGTSEAVGGVSDKRAAIMRAALQLFVQRGFHGTTVPDIAERAGVGAGTIYRYFASKEVLVNELYRAEKQHFAHEALHDIPAVGSARDLFRTLWMRMAKFAVSHSDSLLFLELHHHADYLDAESVALEQRMLALFNQVIVAAQSRGELKALPPHLLMTMVMGAFVGVIRCSLERHEPLADAQWDGAERCMWEAIRI
jgi:AcrR family transcriptional regulator